MSEVLQGVELPDSADHVGMVVLIWIELDRTVKPKEVGGDMLAARVSVHSSVRVNADIDPPQNIMQYLAAARAALDKTKAELKKRME